MVLNKLQKMLLVLFLSTSSSVLLPLLLAAESTELINSRESLLSYGDSTDDDVKPPLLTDKHHHRQLSEDEVALSLKNAVEAHHDRHHDHPVTALQSNGDVQHVMLTKGQYDELRAGGTIRLGQNVRLRAKSIAGGPGSIFDTSKISIFIISILLIVYGSFRSISEDEIIGVKDGEKCLAENKDVSTIDSYQAIFLPLGASLSLLIMFLFFDSLQLVFAVCTAILATIAFAFLLLPMCKYMLRTCSSGQKISFGYCGRYTAAEIMSFCVSLSIVIVWILTGHWLLMDALGMGLCVAFIALVRLPSLKVSTLLLVGLLLYDVFWVFFSSYIFNANVMVKVATKQADNPVGALAKKLHITGLAADAPKLSLPGKIVFPSAYDSTSFSMLGLGDIVMPGLLLCFVLRYDSYKKSQQTMHGDSGVSTPNSFTQRITYFHCSLVGYFLGLLTATISSEVFQAAQPALLYLVPFTLLPLFAMAYLKGDLRRMWSEPFIAVKESKFLNV